MPICRLCHASIFCGMMPRMQIDFFGDLSCPWCHLGWRRLRTALESRPQAQATIRWRPFQLNPDIPLTGIDRSDYQLRKFGNIERVREVQTAIENAMRNDGIAIHLDRIRVTPHTYLAHRLMLLAEKHNQLDATMTRLFMAYFLEGRNIGDPQVLEEEGRAANLPSADITALLNDHSGAVPPEIAESEAEARQLGIKAVPFFLFDRQYSLAGAHDPIGFLPLIDLCQLNRHTESVTVID